VKQASDRQDHRLKETPPQNAEINPQHGEHVPKKILGDVLTHSDGLVRLLFLWDNLAVDDAPSPPNHEIRA
jgi:hypothetical protein